MLINLAIAVGQPTQRLKWLCDIQQQEKLLSLDGWQVGDCDEKKVKDARMLQKTHGPTCDAASKSSISPLLFAREKIVSATAADGSRILAG